MALHTESHDALDISAGGEVLEYTYTGSAPKVVVCRVELGSVGQPIAGSGAYIVALSLNGKNVAPNSTVTVTDVTAILLQSRELLLVPDDTLVVVVTGLDEDTAVDTAASLLDLTPLTKAEVYGDGSTIVDHNYGGTDTYRFVSPTGAGVDNGQVRAYLAADYNAGNRGADYLRGSVTTNSDGRWTAPMMLDTGSYILVFFKQGQYSASAVALTVT